MPHGVASVDELREKRQSGDVNVIYRKVEVLKVLGRNHDLLEALDACFLRYPDDRIYGAGIQALKNRNTAAKKLGVDPVDVPKR